MDGDQQFGWSSNVISLAAVRAARAGKATATHPMPPGDTVYFITGGQFEVMVNGATAVLSAGQFVRVQEGASYGLDDLGGGTVIRHRFTQAIANGLLHELAAAMPPFTSVLPQRGTPTYRRLRAIARRWGVALDSNEAA